MRSLSSVWRSFVAAQQGSLRLNYLQQYESLIYYSKRTVLPIYGDLTIHGQRYASEYGLRGNGTSTQAIRRSRPTSRKAPTQCLLWCSGRENGTYPFNLPSASPTRKLISPSRSCATISPSLPGSSSAPSFKASSSSHSAALLYSPPSPSSPTAPSSPTPCPSAGSTIPTWIT